MDLDKIINFVTDTGRILLESGAETSRIEDTLKRITNYYCGEESETVVVLTGFFVSIGTTTKTVRVNKRTINLDKVSKINMLSRDITSGKVTIDEAIERLNKIEKSKPYPLILMTFAVAVSCAFFTLLSGGNWTDSINSFITGVVMNLFTWLMRKYNIANFIVTFSGGIIISLITIILYKTGIGTNINAMITGAIMPLVPGLAITNAIRDIIAGDYLSGSARMFDAVVAAVALAAGAGISMYLFGNMSGGELL